MRTDDEPHRALAPEIVLVWEPTVKYVLAIETTRGMGDRDTWKWVNKAVQKLVRYDLPAGSQVAILSFSNVTRVESGLEEVSSKVAPK